MKIKFLSFAVLSLALFATSCELPAGAATLPVEVPYQPSDESVDSSATPEPTDLPQATETVKLEATEDSLVVFAVIGDYGQAGPDEFAVAELIDSWQVDFIVTTGDNNYPDGEVSTIDENIGQYFHRYIGNYQGEYNRGSETNRFFPSLGNHDWALGNIDPYLDYFTLPGNERYYDIAFPPVHIFVLDSDTNEPDGVGLSSVQALWLQAGLAISQEEWNLVFMHHPPFSSGLHGSTDWMQWLYKEWGIDAVIAGHDHLYERLLVDDLLYIINGLGGHEAHYDFFNILPGSQARYNQNVGAMRVTVTSQSALFEFITIDGELIDSFTLNAD